MASSSGGSRLVMSCAGLLMLGMLACWQELPARPPPTPAVCGDGIQAGTEACDDGPENSDTKSGACRTTCILAGCGDRIIDPGEACDDGNRTPGDGCAATCRKLEVCGDGIIDPIAEQCDEGPNNSDTSANRCRTDCTPARCGDGVEDRDEECDDGNTENGDTCDSNCTRPRCGNRVTGSGEECDDGNTFNTDGCRPDCLRNTCSGGVDRYGNLCFAVRALAMPEDSDMRAVEIADLDGDGWDDIAVVDRDDDSVKVFWNTSGSFTLKELWVAPIFTLSGDHPVDLAIGDIDEDGKLDLVTANETQDRLCILANKGNRSFERHFIDVAGKPRDVTLANIDGAKGLEVIVGAEDADEVRILRLNQFQASGTPQSLPASDPSSLSAGDADGDGDADICWSVGSPVLAMNESGALIKTSLSNGQSSSPAVKLWDLDGAPPAELVTGVHGLFTRSHLRVFVNSDTTNGSVFDTYSDVPVTKWPVYLARFADGVAYADNGGTFGVLRNEQGTLLDERTFTYDGDAEGLASGDLDHDGSPDLVIISPDKKAVLIFSGQSP
jgi:cysteine-rich repeat protein